MTRSYEVVIVGAGFAGLCMAIKLKEAGLHDFVVLEKAADVGGTWRENTYPGAGCDVMSLMYSYSFAPNREWTRMYARQEEILAYIRRIVAGYGLGPHIRFGTEVTGHEFDEDTDRWHIRTAAGETVTGRVVVAGPGPLHVPSVPDFPGRDRFTGAAFHSAQWDHSYDLTGKRVAAIGTGASAVQFIPQIAKKAAQVKVFQRTPHWLIPKLDRPISDLERRAFKALPGVQRAYRNAIYWSHESSIAGFLNPRWMRGLELIARRHLARQVPDRELRRRLTPDYTIGCKRILISSDYYPALRRDNVDLITDGIAEITETGLRTAAGGHHDVDAIVYGTGFRIGDRFAGDHLVGRGGLTIQQAWRDGIQAFLGVAIAGFPNFFMMVGPNSGGGNQSIVFVIEAQARYILGCLQLMKRSGVTRIEVRGSVQHEFNRRVHTKLAGSVWNSGGCESWYLDDKGFNRAAWPGSSVSYWWRTRRPDPRHFDLGAPEVSEPHRTPATLIADQVEIPVEVHLSGHTQPIDGSYRWFGRITADEEVTALQRAGRREVVLRLPGGHAFTGRLTELDPWGHTRIVGRGRPLTDRSVNP